MSWLKLSVAVPAASLARCEALLWELGAHSISLLDAGGQPILEPPPGETPLWEACRLEALFPEHYSGSDLLARVRAAAPELTPGCESLPERDWERAWLADFRPLRFGERLWVCPSHHRAPDAPGTVALTLDPGLAFGTGTHPTTALCLEWLAEQDLDGQTLLDFGCGSGILAIAALLLGAGRALAVDNDPQALQATAENARRNGVASRLEVLNAADWTPAPAAVVVANILAAPLIAMAAGLAACQRTGERLLLSGVLPAQAGAVRDGYAPWYAFEAPVERDGWARLGARRR